MVQHRIVKSSATVEGMTINTNAYYDAAIRYVDDNSRLPGIVSAETFVRAFDQVSSVPRYGATLLQRLERGRLIQSDHIGRLALTTTIGRSEFEHLAGGGHPRF